MSDRVHGRVDILDSLAGNRRAADQNDRNPEAACRREFGVGGGTAAVLGEDDLHAETFEQRELLRLLGSRETLAAIEARKDPAAIVASWRPQLQAFQEKRLKYLLY